MRGILGLALLGGHLEDCCGFCKNCECRCPSLDCRQLARRLGDPLDEEYLCDEHDCPECPLTTDVQNAPSPSPAPGKCGADDQMAINELGGGTHDGSWPQTVVACSRHSFRWFKGLDKDRFAVCLAERVGISARCSSCFFELSKYAFDHCKLECLPGWRNDICLTCMGRFTMKRLNGCAGFDTPAPKPYVAAQIERDVVSIPEISIPAAIAIGLLAGSGTTTILLSARRAGEVAKNRAL
eukprot:gnl/TRDRNA2_/TRDRNA2_37715_c0_seq1.p2 gnl/TRDRNA2_/TRDRNA2_37715_c0~~gnl/TRDRNA2_/TRDRNA2_37715_c0_seq1.p2  ORF type:complete len:239 (-),score=18.67 gnl/TRDRNA2_/TRDRNA2_37715_c0_seq1:26-742(-)